MNVCKIVTSFCKDVEAAYVSQQRCIWNTEIQTNYSRHDVFSVLYPQDLVFYACLQARNIWSAIGHHQSHSGSFNTSNNERSQ